jgi:protein-disulfide isomerase
MNTELKNLLVVLAVIAVCGVGVFAVMPKGTEGPADAGKLVRETSHMTGSIGATMTIVEFGDFQCPACASYYPLVKQIVAEYGSNPNFNFVFRNFPLPMHQHAMIAAEAAEAAAAQGKFWEMEDLLYTNQKEWSASPIPTDYFLQYAATLKLDVAKFRSDLENHAYQAVIQNDMSDGNALNVQSTPSFYVNGVLQKNIGSYAQFKQMVDAALK